VKASKQTGDLILTFVNLYGFGVYIQYRATHSVQGNFYLSNGKQRKKSEFYSDTEENVRTLNK
jgi:hypothetical protein